MFITKFKTHSFNFTASITMTALLFSGTEKEGHFYTKTEETLHRNNLAPVSDVSVYFADVSQYPKEKKLQDINTLERNIFQDPRFPGKATPLPVLHPRFISQLNMTTRISEQNHI